MSKLKVAALQGLSASSDAITLANDGTCTANITNNLSNRNKIINGAMTVSQRNGTSAVQLSASEQYFIDRWENDSGSSFDMKCDASQSSEAPEGFANSMKFDCDGVSAVSGSHNGLITTFLEGQDLQDLKFGTSNAEDITLSFYAKSGSQNNGHVYGVFLGAYLNGTRNAQTKGFTVTSSWQRFTMTFAGTGTVTSTGINNNNSKGMQVAFSLAVGPDDDENYSTWTANSGLLGFTGQDNFFDNTSNELYITGVQLEVGSVATDFEHKPYAQELALCQRYFYAHSGGDHTVNGSDSSTPNSVLSTASCQSTSSISVAVPLPVPMRAVPSLYSTVAGSTRYRLNSSGANTNSGSDPVVWTAGSSHTTVQMDLAGFSGLSAGQAGTVRRYDGTGILGFNAEL